VPHTTLPGGVPGLKGKPGSKEILDLYGITYKFFQTSKISGNSQPIPKNLKK